MSMTKYNNPYKSPLDEVCRWDILRRSQRESPKRFDKKKFYTAKDFNNVDFKELFENNNFTWSSRVGDYIVTISFEGAFDILKWELKSMKGKNRYKRINHAMLTKALSKAMDNEDLYFECSCDDFKYRFRYWATKADCVYGLPQNTPPKVMNTKNDSGYCCKHILSVLYGKRWVPAAAKCWLEFIKANPDLSEWYIWGESKRSRSSGYSSMQTTDDEDEEDT